MKSMSSVSKEKWDNFKTKAELFLRPLAYEYVWIELTPEWCICTCTVAMDHNRQLYNMSTWQCERCPWQHTADGRHGTASSLIHSATIPVISHHVGVGDASTGGA